MFGPKYHWWVSGLSELSKGLDKYTMIPAAVGDFFITPQNFEPLKTFFAHKSLILEISSGIFSLRQIIK